MLCRILFHDKTLSNFDWVKLDESMGIIKQSGSAGADELKEICSSASTTIIFLPQVDILMTAAHYPARVNKQQLNAIDFAIEDQLAEDIEDCFFAVTGQQADFSIPVAVINRKIMDDCVELLSKQHVIVDLILPQIYLAPWSGEEDLLASICSATDGIMVRYGAHSGLFCQPSILDEVIDLLYRDQSSGRNRIEVYSDNITPGLRFEGLTIDQRGTVEPLSQSIDRNACINLKQKEYQSTHQWVELFKSWKFPLVAMVILGLIMFSSFLIDVREKNVMYHDLIARQQILLKQHLPEMASGDQPKKQLIELLRDTESNEGQAGFVDLLHEYSRLKSGFSAISTHKVLYQNSDLIVNIETDELKTLESFRANLEKSRFDVEIENVNIDPDKTTGRLVMRGS